MKSRVEDIFVQLVAGIVGNNGWLHDRLNRTMVDRHVRQGAGLSYPPLPVATDFEQNGSAHARLLPAIVEEHNVEAYPPVAEVVQLFAAPEEGQRACSKSTCLFPAFAQYVTDGLVRTMVHNDPAQEDRGRNSSTHHFDLSPLYGRNAEQERILRRCSERAGEKGRMLSHRLGNEEWAPWLFRRDGAGVETAFAGLDLPLGLDNIGPEAKMTLFAFGGNRANASPQVAMMNTLFLREHNRLAGLIEAGNPKWDDQRIFTVARDVNIIQFLRILLEELFNHISPSPFRVRKRAQVGWNRDWVGENPVALESSFFYRWHSLMPEKMRWGADEYAQSVLRLDNSLLLSRGLANAFADVAGNAACEVGLQNSAGFMVPLEQVAIQHCRNARIPSYHHYRRAMGMRSVTSFPPLVGKARNEAEQARRTQLAQRLEQLYGSPEQLEFYPGLFAEPRERNGCLPPLMTKLVAMDLCARAFSNPLLVQEIWVDLARCEAHFTKAGLGEFEKAHSLREVLLRNSSGLANRFIGMTRPEWKRE